MTLKLPTRRSAHSRDDGFPMAMQMEPSPGPFTCAYSLTQVQLGGSTNNCVGRVAGHSGAVLWPPTPPVREVCGGLVPGDTAKLVKIAV